MCELPNATCTAPADSMLLVCEELLLATNVPLSTNDFAYTYIEEPIVGGKLLIGWWSVGEKYNYCCFFFGFSVILLVNAESTTVRVAETD